MITVTAPGKLFIAGEYAVVEPAQPSVLVAVDRYLAVTLTPAHGVGTVSSPEYSSLPLIWTRSANGLRIDREHHPYDYVMAVITLVDALRAERVIAPQFFDTRIDSQLDDVSGRKFGLGSSAAVTVATVRALDKFYDLHLTRTETFKLALLATVRVAPAASGGDLAASTFGGWIRYCAPDRAALAAQLDRLPVSEVLECDAWEGFSIERLPQPKDLTLLVGWTGSPASTARLVEVVQRQRAAGTIDYDSFLESSRHWVDMLTDGLRRGLSAPVTTAVRGARSVLRWLGEQADVPIETPALSVLCDTAEAAGAAAKSSGAGGGDCGIVLAPPSVDLAALLREWETHDIRRLTLAVHQPEGTDL